ncbi:MAG: hypothetical protein M1839_002452 [Geoglossum umbratile]|nr:MAG: hypothetical protein M1839_002452 [Geoglossum umbratile]
MKPHTLLLLLLGVRLTHSKSFIDAISSYPRLSNFTQLMVENPPFADLLLGATSTQGIQTILVPSNTAFSKYENDTGHSIESLDPNIIQRLIQYHTLNSSLTSSELANRAGVVVSSQLVDINYDNRGQYSNVQTPGQVVYISSANSVDASTFATGGLGSAVPMDVVDGTFDNGVFQIVDRFLTLPTNCYDTMATVNLSSVSAALNRTSNVDKWNNQPGITCLAPTDEAFRAVGNLSSTDEVENTLYAHTILSPQYTPILQDGQTFTSQANTTIKVTIKDGRVYFNDAKVIRSNIISNNGVIHVLDKVMSPASNATGTASGTTTATTSTSSSTAKPKSGGSSVVDKHYQRSVLIVSSLAIVLGMFVSA